MRRQTNAAIFKILIKRRNSFLNRSLPCISCFIFLQSFRTVEIGQCNLTVGCNRTTVIGQSQMKKHHTRSTQLNPPITELITITIATTTYPEKRKLVNFKNWISFFLFHVVSTGDVCPKCNCCLRKFLITRYDYRPNWIPLDPITIINHKVAIYSIVIGLKNSHYPLIHLPSFHRRVCYPKSLLSNSSIS